MRKRIAHVIFYFMYCCFPFFAGAQVSSFQKTFGGANQDFGFAVISTYDGGYAMAGYTNSFHNGDYDALLIKLDSNANFEWSATFGGAGDDGAIQLVQTYDSGYALCGKATGASGTTSAMLLKCDASGHLSWIKLFGGFVEDRFLNIRLTSDSGFILAGSIMSSGTGFWHELFVKTDADGDTAWARVISGANYAQGTDAIETTDGGYVLCGRATDIAGGSGDISLIKTNASGDTMWTHIIGGPGWEEGMKVKQTFDGGFIIAGASTSFGNTSYDAYLVKTDTSGIVEWSKVYSGLHNDAVYDVVQAKDSGYIITGITESFGSNHARPLHTQAPAQIDGTEHSNVLVIRTDAQGDTIWSKAYGGANRDEAYSVISTRDNSWMIGAYGIGSGSDSIKFYLIGTDSSGNSGCVENDAPVQIIVPATTERFSQMEISIGCGISSLTNTGALNQPITQRNICTIQQVEEIEKFKWMLYPNPSKGLITAKFQAPASPRSVITIINLDGVEVMKFYPMQKEEFKMDISSLPAGMYFMRIDQEIKKLILLPVNGRGDF